MVSVRRLRSGCISPLSRRAFPEGQGLLDLERPFRGPLIRRIATSLLAEAAAGTTAVARLVASGLAIDDKGFLCEAPAEEILV
jgi:hypothetical protein